MPWLRRTFLAGFFFTVPLFVSLAALVWIFGIIDGFTAPLATQIMGRETPLARVAAVAVGVLVTACSCWRWVRWRPT